MHSLRRATIGLTVAVIAASASCTPPANEPPSLPALERVSVASDGAQSSGASYAPSISADGRVVSFSARGRDLIAGTSTPPYLAYVRDRSTGTTELVSKSADGVPANRQVDSLTLSDDGRKVAFVSAASNLVAGDANDFDDVFVYDRVTATTIRVSASTAGAAANQGSYDAVISGNGRFVAFTSLATNLVPGDTNSSDDVFVHDLVLGTTARVSVSSLGVAGSADSFSPAISDDGRIVAFRTVAPNLGAGSRIVEVAVHDRQTGVTTIESVGANGTRANEESLDPVLSSDGQILMFLSFASNLVPGDTNRAIDVFVRDRTAQTTSRVSVASDGTQANTDENSQTPYGDISADGWLVAFHSEASNLVVGDNNDDFDVFLHDRQTGATTLASTTMDGAQGNQGSFDPVFSGDARSIAFVSSATNFAPGDTNNREDVFVRRLGP